MLLSGVECKVVEPVKNGKFTGPTERSGTWFKDTIILSCNTNYEIDGDNQMTCQANGEWSNAIGACTKISSTF